MTKLRGVCYARFSSNNQREESIEAQVRAMQYYAQNFGIEIVKVYADRAKTGKFDDRPQFQKMIQDSAKGEFDVVLVHKLDRFSRNPADTNHYEKVLNQNKVKLISVIEKLDESPEGQLMKQIIIGMNAFYSANLAREVRKGLKENALQAKFTGGIAPFGYKIVNGNYVIDEELADVVVRIFNLYIGGMGKTQIAKMLNEEGYRTSKGKLFYPRLLGDILKNSKYAGIYSYTIDGETIMIDGGVPPIISYDTFLDAQAVAKNRHKRKDKGEDTHSLTGKMVCGQCGSNFYAGSSTKNRYGTVYRYYTCSGTATLKCDAKRVNKTHIEWFLVDQIAEHILDDDVIDRISEEAVTHANAEIKSPVNSSEDLEKKAKEINAKLDKLMDLYVSDLIDKKTVSDKASELNKELSLIESEKRKAIQLEKAEPLTKEDFSDYLKSYRIDVEDKEMVLALIDTFVDKVIVYEDKLEVNFKIDFSALGGAQLRKNNKVSENKSLAPLYRSISQINFKIETSMKDYRKSIRNK